MNLTKIGLINPFEAIENQFPKIYQGQGETHLDFAYVPLKAFARATRKFIALIKTSLFWTEVRT